MPLGREIGLGPGDIVLDGDPAPDFSPHVCYGKTARWIKVPFGTEVDLGPGHIVLRRDPAPPTERGTAPPPHFSACVYCGQTVAHLSNC